MTDREKRWFGIFGALASRGSQKPALTGARLLADDSGPTLPDSEGPQPSRPPEPAEVESRPETDALATEPDAEAEAEAEVEAEAEAEVGFEEATTAYVAGPITTVWASHPLEDAETPRVDETWISAKTLREQSLLRLMLGQQVLRAALVEGPVVELRASAGAEMDALLPVSAAVEVNADDAKAAQAAVRRLDGGVNVIFVRDALQFLSETRQFLGACFSKVRLGGFLIVSVPHQFLFERKLRLPSRRSPLHRRFYTANSLLADVEEAIDPCEFRIRFLGDSDAKYHAAANLSAAPAGGQDIVLAIEKVALPPWRSALDADEIWDHKPSKAVRYLPIDRKQPAALRVIAPDPTGVSRVIVVKLDHRGDFQMAAEAFKVLRNAFASAELTIVCGSWNVAEAKQGGLFDEVIPFDFFPEDDSARQHMPSRESLVADFVARMQGKSYDLAIDLRLYDDTRMVLKAIDARVHAGFDRFDSFPWLTIRLDAASATADDRAEIRVVAAEHFHTAIGKHRSFEIRSDEPVRLPDRRSVIWGPYHSLPSGHYQFECLIEPLGKDFDTGFDIACDAGRRIVVAGPLAVRRGVHPVIAFSVENKIDSFEFRINGGDRGLEPFRFLGVRYVRQGPIRGVHQTEAMALLARLVELRMRDAFTMELA